ncbi:hypothetical protein D5S17_20315 [Pseudonocardiaceae bacterium YIM PH 21723]|nr:hypothetical protein D5S17_20315 [Pseudonocardiaceae bacterium YIM PH 21723]
MLRRALSVVGAVALALSLFTPVASAAEIDGRQYTQHAPDERDLPAWVQRDDRLRLCMSGHVQNLGWQNWSCSDETRWAEAGTEGRGLRLEAVRLYVRGTRGWYHAAGHVENIGDQNLQSTGNYETLTVGTTGQGLGLEQMLFAHDVKRTCGQGHVRDIGWQDWECVPPRSGKQVGTRGQARPLEKVKYQILSVEE